MRRIKTLTPAALVALATFVATDLAAQGLIEPDLRWPTTSAVERLSSDVRIHVDGARRVARVEVEEVFRNRSATMVEGDYLYPIPAGAVFTDFSLFMDGEELKGEVLPAERARSIYEEIVRRKKDPALIELVGHGVLRSRVFPIEPGATRRVILRYTQVLGRDGDLLRVKYPRIIATTPGSEGLEQGSLQRPERRHPFTLQIRVADAESYATPYSPTHTIDVRERRGELDISYEGSGASNDFELFLPMVDALVGASVVTHAPAGEDGYFMLLISPPAEREESEIPRDVTLVLDTSGSMSGDKMEQARAALDQILAGLRREDRFRLITFSSVVRSFRRDFAAANTNNVRAAREFLDGVRAEGGTNVMDALREALDPTAAPGRLSIVVFVTDGKPTVGETSPERIAEMVEQLRDRERLFNFGVGHDVNTYLLDRMAQGGRGSVTYVRPGEDVEEAVSSLNRKISHPALADLRVVEAPVELEDFYPNPIPDLFYGEELVLFGRYRGAGGGELVLEGSRAGETLRLRYATEFARRENGNDFIPRLWAARKAGALTAQIRLHGANPEIVEEIRQLGLRYGILTEYTSYLVEEPVLALADEDIRFRAMEMASDLAAAPVSQSGARAFARSEASAKLAATDRLSEAEELSVATTSITRQVGRRLFTLRDGTWTDVRFDPSLKMIEVAPYSDAYFDLVARLPGLRRYLALGERVIIAGDGLSISLTETGLTRWGRRDLKALTEAFAALD